MMDTRLVCFIHPLNIPSLSGRHRGPGVHPERRRHLSGEGGRRLIPAVLPQTPSSGLREDKQSHPAGPLDKSASCAFVFDLDGAETRTSCWDIRAVTVKSESEPNHRHSVSLPDNQMHPQAFVSAATQGKKGGNNTGMKHSVSTSCPLTRHARLLLPPQGFSDNQLTPSIRSFGTHKHRRAG